MAKLAPMLDVQETLDKFDRLWMIADEQAAARGAARDGMPSLHAAGMSRPVNRPTWSLDQVALPDGNVSPELRMAIGNGEPHLEYQPIYDREGAVASVEAFVRWRHVDGETVRADVLIPKVIDAGLLPELDLWVLHAAAKEAASWPVSRGQAPRLAVNMSAQIALGDLFEDAIVEVVLATGLELSRLSIEIEDLAIRRLSLPKLAKLSHLASHRMGLSVDDFGRGYETLAGLEGLPIDSIKIDDSIVQHVSAASTELKVAQRVSDSAVRMGIAAIATGIESQQQFELLRAMGVSGYQGYLFGRPMSARELMDLLKSQ